MPGCGPNLRGCDPTPLKNLDETEKGREDGICLMQLWADMGWWLGTVEGRCVERKALNVNVEIERGRDLRLMAEGALR